MSTNSAPAGAPDGTRALNTLEEQTEEAREEMRVRTDCGYRLEPLALKAQRAWKQHQIYYDDVPDIYQLPGHDSRGGEAR